MQIAAMTTLSYPTVRAAIDLFDAGGWSAIRPALRGRARGDGRVLSQVQQAAIQRLSIDKRPEQLKMNFSLWSRAASASTSSAGALHRKNPSSAPTNKARLRCKPGLKGNILPLSSAQEAKALKFTGAMRRALVNTDVRGRSFAPAGKTPVVMAVGGKDQKLSMIATVTNQGKARWMIIDEAFDADKLIQLLQALIKDAGKKVFLILDNLRVHHSKLVKAWVAQRQDQIELFYLPSYSPQRNPEDGQACTSQNQGQITRSYQRAHGGAGAKA